jgi:predicted metalloprotease
MWGRSLLAPNDPAGVTSTSVSSRKWTLAFHAQGDFARAYVIAHRVVLHHVQNALGTFDAR